MCEQHHQQWTLRAIFNPQNQQNRPVMRENFGIQLPLINERRPALVRASAISHHVCQSLLLLMTKRKRKYRVCLDQKYLSLMKYSGTCDVRSFQWADTDSTKDTFSIVPFNMILTKMYLQSRDTFGWSKQYHFWYVPLYNVSFYHTTSRERNVQGLQLFKIATILIECSIEVLCLYQHCQFAFSFLNLFMIPFSAWTEAFELCFSLHSSLNFLVCSSKHWNQLTGPLWIISQSFQRPTVWTLRWSHYF